MTDSWSFLREQTQNLLEPAKRQTIPEWMAENFRLPSDTSEPEPREADQPLLRHADGEDHLRGRRHGLLCLVLSEGAGLRLLQ